MNNNTVYVGMDVHKESFSLYAYIIEAVKAAHHQKTESDYKKILKYLEFLRTIVNPQSSVPYYYTAFLR